MADRARFAHPGAVAAAAGLGLVVSTAIAARDDVSRWELDLTQWINDVPQWVADVLYPVMQLGTLAAPFVVAIAIVVVRRDWLLALMTIVAGLIAWFGAKGVKKVVARGRPLQYLPDIHAREGKGTGLGFISGHSAVAAASAVMLMVALPRRWRPAVAVVAALVGIARIVFGVHLPADVVGGWSFGVLVALGCLWVLDVVESYART
jgi:glycosyltransferase 2 family protein